MPSATPTYANQSCVVGICSWAVTLPDDSIGICGREFVRMHPGQDVCSVHALKRRMQIQVERSRMNRKLRKQRLDRSQ